MTDWTTSADGFSVGIDDDGELSTATVVLLAGAGRGLAGARHAAADKAAVESVWRLAPRLKLIDIKPAARACRAAARRVLDTDNDGMRAGVWSDDVAAYVARRWL
jgi:hypothetical protein